MCTARRADTAASCGLTLWLFPAGTPPRGTPPDPKHWKAPPSSVSAGGCIKKPRPAGPGTIASNPKDECGCACSGGGSSPSWHSNRFLGVAARRLWPRLTCWAGNTGLRWRRGALPSKTPSRPSSFSGKRCSTRLPLVPGAGYWSLPTASWWGSPSRIKTNPIPSGAPGQDGRAASSDQANYSGGY